MGYVLPADIATALIIWDSVRPKDLQMYFIGVDQHLSRVSSDTILYDARATTLS